jgi:hypothetical protein
MSYNKTRQKMFLSFPDSFLTIILIRNKSYFTIINGNDGGI